MKIYFLIVLALIVIAFVCKAAMRKTPKANDLQDNELKLYPNALYPMSINGKWGYMNNEFKPVISSKFSRVDDFHEGLAVVSIKVKDADNVIREVQGYIDTTGKIVIPCEYETAAKFHEGLAAVSKAGKYGYIDKKGNEIIPFIYEEASKFSEGLACVKLNGKNGFIDKAANMVIQPQFARACWVSDFSEGLAAVYTSEEGPGGYIDKTGVFIIPPNFNYVSAFSEGYALVRPKGNNKYGYINAQGEMIIEPKYELSLPFTEGLATVKLLQPNGDAIFNIIDKKGNAIASNLKYAFVGIFKDGLAGVESYDHRWGFIDKTGTEAIAPQFAGVKFFQNGLARMETGNLFDGTKTVYINKKGKVVWKE